jgi:hypothetical protein
MKLIKKVTPRSGSTMCYLNKNIKKIKKIKGLKMKYRVILNQVIYNC